jgi:hypothetical protein
LGFGAQDSAQVAGSLLRFLGSLWMSGHSLIVSASHLFILRRSALRTSAGYTKGELGAVMEADGNDVFVG